MGAPIYCPKYLYSASANRAPIYKFFQSMPWIILHGAAAVLSAMTSLRALHYSGYLLVLKDL